MATFYFYDEVVSYIFEPSGITGGGPIDFETDAFNCYLSNETADATTQQADSVLADITQIAGTGGYTTQSAANPVFGETGAGSGVWEFSTDNVAWTASGADFATARYIGMYDDDIATPADVLIGFLDYGAGGFTLTDGNTFTVTVGANGWFQITVPNYA
jgi:hypothetical protein